MACGPKLVAPVLCFAVAVLLISSFCVEWTPMTVNMYLDRITASVEPQWSEPDYLAMCLIVKDQPEDTVEWIEYHRRIGATKFYVFDHNSTVPLIKQLYGYVEAGIVEYRFFREFEMDGPGAWAQTWVYDTCIKEYGSRHRWMAFIDTDEFLTLGEGVASLPELLQSYEAYGGLAVNVRLIGSSGHVTRPPGGMLRNYNACIPMQHPENLHVKTIGNMWWTLKGGMDPHHFIYTPGKFAVDEEGGRVDGARTGYVRGSKISLYHYATRSLEDFSAKVERGPAHGHLGKTLVFWDLVEGAANETCSRLQDWVAERDVTHSWYF